MKRYVISHSTIIKNKIDIISNHDEVLDFHEGLARVCFNDKWGYINKEGKEVVKPIYDHALDFHEGLAAVCLNGKWGYINKEGKEVVKPIYDEASDFHEGLAAVCLNDKWGYINKEGKEVVKPIYDYVDNFHEGLAAVESNGKWGYINKEGKEVVKPIYDHASDFQDGLAAVCLNGKWGVIDKEGNQIIDCTFNFINISDGMIIFDKKYMVDIKTMELLYSFKLSLGNKTIEKSFDDKNKRDKYIKEIDGYLKEKNNEVDILKKQLEEQIKGIENSYIDDALEIVNSYYKKYQD